jgi:phytoene synthase
MMRVDGTAVARAYDECQAITRTHARSFYFSSHVLAREKRLSSYAVYAFCRKADNAVDSVGEPLPYDEARRNLADMRRQLDVVYEGQHPLQGPLLALRDTVERYQIPREYFSDLLRGVEMDLTQTRYQTFDQLKEYCYCVASVVGLMMTKVFGLRNESALQNAIDMGTAMQLTNILRDIKEDYAMGRVYLPQEDLSRFGYTEEDLGRGIINENFTALMRFEISRAREYYQRAERGIPFLSDAGSRYCVRLMSATYAGILDRIEKGRYDVFSRRAHVPIGGKIGLAVHLLLGSQAPKMDLVNRSVEARTHQ